MVITPGGVGPKPKQKQPNTDRSSRKENAQDNSSTKGLRTQNMRFLGPKTILY